MTELIPDIRNTTRALIIQQDKILLLRKESEVRGEYFALPGGGQDPSETLFEALNRECIEEIGTSVEIGDLIHVVDFYKLRDTQPPTRRHLVEFLFQCMISDNYSPRNGHHPDKHQVEVVWADLSNLAHYSLFPQYLSTCIPYHEATHSNIYLGTFHDRTTPQEY